jgi:alanine racemase
LGFHRNWVEVDLGAIAHNLREIRQKAGQGVKVLAVVKSDAYGHGAQELGLLLERCGVEMLGVASIEEGAVLREKGIKLPILVLGCVFPGEIEEFFHYSLTPNLCELTLAKEFSRRAVRLGLTTKVHVKVDTGMGGLGVRVEESARFVQEVMGLPCLTVEGLFTHFNSNTADDSNQTYEQLRLFKGVIEELSSLDVHIPLKHAANSRAILRVPEACLNMVRPGLLLYGLTPQGCLNLPEVDIKLRPAMTFKTRLGYIKELRPGETVSYGRSYTASHRTRIGVLPVGYDSGYNLRLSNKGHVVIRGKRFPVVGRVRMNFIHVDLGREEGVEVGDEVTLYGGGVPGAYSVEEVAGLMEGSPYEVLCATGRLNPRTYLGASEPALNRPGSGPAVEYAGCPGEAQFAGHYATAA